MAYGCSNGREDRSERRRMVDVVVVKVAQVWFFSYAVFFFFMELMDNGEGFAYERWLTVKKALLVQRKTLISLDTM